MKRWSLWSLVLFFALFLQFGTNTVMAEEPKPAVTAEQKLEEVNQEMQQIVNELNQLEKKREMLRARGSELSGARKALMSLVPQSENKEEKKGS